MLSDNDKRFKYDEIFQKNYALEDAQDTFNQFFKENDFIDENESQFFN